MSEDVREAFERAAKVHLWQEGPFLRDCNDIDATRTYELYYIENAWLMWQAATASTEAKWRGLVEKLVEAASDAKDQLWLLSKNPDSCPWQKQLKEALAQAAQKLGGK